MLLCHYSLPYARQHWFKILAIIICLSLSISIFFSTATFNKIILNSYQKNSAEFVADNLTLLKARNGGTSLQNYQELKRAAPEAILSPLYQEQVSINNAKQLTQLAGIDLVTLGQLAGNYQGIAEGSRSNDLLILKHSAQSLEESLPAKQITVQNSAGKTLSAQLLVVNLGSEYQNAADFYFTDLYTFYELTGRADPLAAIIVDPLQKELLLQLAESNQLKLREGSASRVRINQNLSESLRINLLFLGLLAFALALIIIFNLLVYLFISRQTDFAALRLLGVTNVAILKLLIIEAAVLASCALLAGSLIGFLANIFSSQIFAQSVAVIYNFKTSLFYIPDLSGFLIIAALTYLAALLAVIFAYYAQQRLFAGANSLFISKWLHKSRKILLTAAITSLGLSAACSLTDVRPLLILPPVLLILSAALLIPLTINLPTSWLKTRSGILAFVADYIRSNLFWQTLNVLTLTISLGMVFGVGSMIVSFKSSVSQWIQTVISADVYMTKAESFLSEGEQNFKRSTINYLRQHPAVAEIDYAAFTDYQFADLPVKIIGTIRPAAADKFAFLQQRTFKPSASINISEPFASKTGLGLGDPLELEYSGRKQRFEIAGIYQDYKSEFGSLTMHWQLYEKLTGFTLPQVISLNLKTGADQSRLFKDLEQLRQQDSFSYTDQDKIKSAVLDVFNSTFRFTYNILLITLLSVLLSSIINIIIVSKQQDKARQILRVCGANSKQISSLLQLTVGLILGVGILFGLLLGLLLSLYLIFVVNTKFFGWSIVYSFNLTLVAGVCAGIIGLIAIAVAIINRVEFSSNQKHE